MKIAVQDLHRVINDYLVQVIAPKIKNEVFKYSLSFGASYLSEQTLNNMLGHYGQIAVMLGIIQDGMIDIEQFRENALKALKVCGNKVSYMDYGFDVDDIEALYKIMSSYAKS